MFLAVCIASAFLISNPFFAAAPVPDMSAIGVASPKAHGQAITMVETIANIEKERGSEFNGIHGNTLCAVARKVCMPS